MRHGCLLLAVGLIALFLSVPASAQDKHAAQAEAQKDLQQEAKHIKKDLFAPAMDLGIWTLVVFLVLLFVLSKFAWKPMLQGLEHRERSIHSALEEAQKAREEAERLRNQFDEQMRKANEQSRGILDEARRAAERTTGDMIAEARKEIQAERDRLQREVNLARDQAVREIWSQAADLATLVSSKAIRRQLNPSDHRQLVDEALAELRQAGDGRPRTAHV